MTEQITSGHPIERQLQDLLAYLREELDRELKGWLDLTSKDDRANLAQAMLALANHGGGYVILGFEEADGRWVPAGSRPPDLSGYTQDLFNSIVQGYADPSFHCDMHLVQDPQTNDVFPVIVVPGGHRVPIRAARDGPDRNHVQKDTYYIRRPGPTSEPPRSGIEWDALIHRCVMAAREDLIENLRSILIGFTRTPVVEMGSSEENAKRKLGEWVSKARGRWKSLLAEKSSGEVPSYDSNGIWTVAYSVVGTFDPPTLADLLSILRKVEGRETGWPPWWASARGEMEPYCYEDLVECWLAKDNRFRDPAHADFWRASPDGMLFLLRGYREDSHQKTVRPGTIIALTFPIWHIGECLLHAERLAKELANQSADILLHATWEGLEGRKLMPWPDPSADLTPPMFVYGQPSRQDIVRSEILVPVDQISAALPEIVRNVTAPLYQTFDFYRPEHDMIAKELAKMRRLRP